MLRFIEVTYVIVKMSGHLIKFRVDGGPLRAFKATCLEELYHSIDQIYGNVGSYEITPKWDGDFREVYEITRTLYDHETATKSTVPIHEVPDGAYESSWEDEPGFRIDVKDAAKVPWLSSKSDPPLASNTVFEVEYNGRCVYKNPAACRLASSNIPMKTIVKQAKDLEGARVIFPREWLYE